MEGITLKGLRMKKLISIIGLILLPLIYINMLGCAAIKSGDYVIQESQEGNWRLKKELSEMIKILILL